MTLAAIKKLASRLTRAEKIKLANHLLSGSDKPLRKSPLTKIKGRAISKKYTSAVAADRTRKSSKPLSEAALISEATRRLLQGIKEHSKSQGKPLDYTELRNQGYSKEFVADLQSA